MSSEVWDIALGLSYDIANQKETRLHCTYPHANRGTKVIHGAQESRRVAQLDVMYYDAHDRDRRTSVKPQHGPARAERPAARFPDSDWHTWCPGRIVDIITPREPAQSTAPSYWAASTRIRNLQFPPP